MPRGILAIFNNVAPGRDADFDGWFQSEHLQERVGVPGFLYGQRHKAISGSAGYFNFYVTESSAVLTSKAYFDRINNPTPRTKMVMSEIFRDMNRTVCRREFRLGELRSAMSVTARFAAATDLAALKAELEALAARDETTSGEVWSSAETPGAVMEEEKLRGGDKKIQACLFVSALHQAQAETIGQRLQRRFPDADVGLFRVLSHLGDSRA